MSRKERVLKRRYAVFCEGDTEYNYTDKMRKRQGVELVLKPINMHGGGYSNLTMLDIIRTQEKLVKNCYEIKKKTFDISIRSTEYNPDVLGRKTSNIEEFFDVIDW